MLYYRISNKASPIRDALRWLAKQYIYIYILKSNNIMCVCACVIVLSFYTQETQHIFFSKFIKKNK